MAAGLTGLGSASTSAGGGSCDAPRPEECSYSASEFRMLKSSVAEIAICVEDLQSNMIIVMSMLAQLSPKAEGTMEPEVRTQCQRMKALAHPSASL